MKLTVFHRNIIIISWVLRSPCNKYRKQSICWYAYCKFCASWSWAKRLLFNLCCTATSNELEMTKLTKSNQRPSSRLDLLSKRTWRSTLGRRNLVRTDLSQNQARSYHRTHDIEPVTMKGYWNWSEKSKILRGTLCKFMIQVCKYSDCNGQCVSSANSLRPKLLRFE